MKQKKIYILVASILLSPLSNAATMNELLGKKQEPTTATEVQVQKYSIDEIKSTKLKKSDIPELQTQYDLAYKEFLRFIDETEKPFKNHKKYIENIENKNNTKFKKEIETLEKKKNLVCKESELPKSCSLAEKDLKEMKVAEKEVVDYISKEKSLSKSLRYERLNELYFRYQSFLKTIKVKKEEVSE